MRIMGLDPGTIYTGIGVIETTNNKTICLYKDRVNLSKLESLPEKLGKIYSSITEVLKNFTPDEFAIETAFYGKDAQAALKIGNARGVSMLAAYHKNVPVTEYSPREIKKSVTGNGNATKEQVQYMVFKLLELPEVKLPLDTTDALAIALCHSYRFKNITTKNTNWKAFIENNPGRVIL